MTSDEKKAAVLEACRNRQWKLLGEPKEIFRYVGTDGKLYSCGTPAGVELTDEIRSIGWCTVMGGYIPVGKAYPSPEAWREAKSEYIEKELAAFAASMSTPKEIDAQYACWVESLGT